MTRLQAESVTFTYPGALSPALNGVNLDAPPGRLTVLIGPSGCGKTTFLRLVAGLARPDAGKVYFDGLSVEHVPAERRGAVLLFQKPLLLPHMSVIENVAFGLQARGVARSDRLRSADRMLRLVQLAGFGSRRPETLSGGQAQRVALARALVTEPKVLLLDEPLSGLDSRLRGEMSALILELQRRLGTTTLLVTHNLEEALSMADKLAVMINGSIRQSGEPRSIYQEPFDVECAKVLGAENILPGTKSNGRFEAAFGSLACDPECRPDGPATAIVRAERIVVGPASGATTVRDEATSSTSAAFTAHGPNTARDSNTAWDFLSIDGTNLEGTVIASSFHGHAEHVRVRVDTTEIQVTQAAGSNASLSPGSRVAIHFPADAVHLVSSGADLPW